MSKVAALLFAFFIMFSTGVMVEVTRFYVFCSVDITVGTQKVLPTLCRFLINLPSTELHSKYRVFILLFLLPWFMLVLRAPGLSAEMLWRKAIVRSVLALTVGGLVMTSMIYPLMPRFKLLEPEVLPSSSMADGIALVFGLLLIAVVVRLVLVLRKRKPGSS